MNFCHVIESKCGYWNNELGWVKHVSDATCFDDMNYNLPAGDEVEWVLARHCS